MSEKTIARRYAKALIRSLRALKDQDAVNVGRQTLQRIQELLAVPMARSVIASPVMPWDLQEKLLQYAIGTQKDPEGIVHKFLKFVKGAGRLALLGEICRSFQEILDEDSGVMRGHIQSAVELQPNEVQEIKKYVHRLAGQQADLQTEVDRDLIGGFVVKLGNMYIDCSVRTKLEQLAQAALEPTA